MKVKIDGSLCTGQGRCYSLEPELFEPDDEGYNRDRGTIIDVPDEQGEAARHTVRKAAVGDTRADV